MMDVNTLKLLYKELSDLNAELNEINDNYPRRVGTMVMVNEEMESHIEEILDKMESCILQIRQEGIPEDIDESDRELLINTLADTERWINENREQVNNARAFLANYCAC